MHATTHAQIHACTKPHTIDTPQTIWNGFKQNHNSNNKNFKVGSLVIVPATTRIACVLNKSADAQSQWACGGESPAGMKMVLIPLGFKDIVCPAWAVSTTEDKSEANVAIEKVKVTLSACFVGQVGNQKQRVLMIPTIVNKKAIAKKAELKLYVAKVETDVNKSLGSGSAKRAVVIGDDAGSAKRPCVLATVV